LYSAGTATKLYPEARILNEAAMCTAKLLQSDNNNLKYLGVNALSAIVKVHVGSCYGCDCVRADLSLSQASHSHHALCGAVLCNSMRPAADTDYLAACICVIVHFPEPPACLRLCVVCSAVRASLLVTGYVHACGGVMTTKPHGRVCVHCRSIRRPQRSTR
jgi:hypothetical protein